MTETFVCSCCGQRREFMYCPFCGERIAQAAQLCPHCGKDVATAILSEPETITALPQTSKISEPRSKGGLVHVVLPIVSFLLIMKLGAGLYKTDNDLRVHQSSGSVSSVQSKVEEDKEPKTNTAISFQNEESIGSIQLVDGRVLEWFSNSPAALCYELKSFTPMQMNQFYQVFDGQDIYFYGEVTGVYEDGTIVIHCIDEDASEAAGLSWPMVASVTLHTSERKDLLMQLSEGDAVTAIGAIHSGSYFRVIFATLLGWILIPVALMCFSYLKSNHTPGFNLSIGAHSGIVRFGVMSIRYAGVLT